LPAQGDGDVVIIEHLKVEQGAIATPYTLNEAEEQANIIQFYKPFARAYRSTSDQNDLADGVWTKVLLNAESYDLGSNFTIATNTFITPITGIYRITGQVEFEDTDLVADKNYGVAIYAAGATIATNYQHSSLVATLSGAVPTLAKLDESVAITLYAVSNSGDGAVDINSGAAKTFLEIELVTLDI